MAKLTVAWLVIENSGCVGERTVGSYSSFSAASRALSRGYPSDEIDSLGVRIARERNGMVSYDY